MLAQCLIFIACTFQIFEVPNQGIGTFSSRVTLEPPHYDGVQSLALRDNVLFSGSRDYVIKKWDLDSKELLTSINNAHRDWVCGLAFVQKQPILVSVCRSGILKLWFTDTCTQIGEMKAHDSSINAITTNSSQIFTASHDNTIKIWRLSNKVDFVYAENSWQLQVLMHILKIFPRTVITFVIRLLKTCFVSIVFIIKSFFSVLCNFFSNYVQEKLCIYDCDTWFMDRYYF